MTKWLEPIRIPSSIVLSLAVLAWAGGARAQAPAPAYKFEKKEEVKTVEWKATAQAGLIVTTGNSNTKSGSAGANVTRKDGKNKLALDLNAAYVRAEILIVNDVANPGVVDPGEIDRTSRTTNKSWAAQLRYDRFLTDLNSLYALGRAAADEPAGKDFFGGAQVGYSRRLLKNDLHDLAVELGYDFTYEDYVGAAEANDIHSARAFAGYVAKVAGETGLEASVEALFNLNEEKSPVPGETIGAFKDTRVIGKAAVATKLFEDISFRVAFTATYDQAPAPAPTIAGLPYAPGFVPLADELDTKTEAVIVVSFL